jgi:Raf kinase inhibitor-like YbhB/YbcL family protein
MKNTGTFTLTSTSFKHHQTMPLIHAQIGFSNGSLNVSPDLIWGNVPEKTKSFALVCEDPDAVGGTFTHWVVYNIPEKVHELPSHVPSERLPQSLGTEGVNDYGIIGYGGPRPPAGTGLHRYVFTLYALDSVQGLKSGLSAADLRNAIKGHVIAEAQLIGLVAAPAL